MNKSVSLWTFKIFNSKIILKLLLCTDYNRTNIFWYMTFYIFAFACFSYVWIRSTTEESLKDKQRRLQVGFLLNLNYFFEYFSR